MFLEDRNLIAPTPKALLRTAVQRAILATTLARSRSRSRSRSLQTF